MISGLNPYAGTAVALATYATNAQARLPFALSEPLSICCEVASEAAVSKKERAKAKVQAEAEAVAGRWQRQKLWQ